jgi:hypothetical protein
MNSLYETVYVCHNLLYLFFTYDQSKKEEMKTILKELHKKYFCQKKNLRKVALISAKTLYFLSIIKLRIEKKEKNQYFHFLSKMQ